MSDNFVSSPPNGGPWVPAQFGLNIVGNGATHTINNTSGGTWIVTNLDVSIPALEALDTVIAVLTATADSITIWSDSITPESVGQAIYFSWRGLLVLPPGGVVAIHNESLLIGSSFGYSLSGWMSTDQLYTGPDVWPA